MLWRRTGALVAILGLASCSEQDDGSGEQRPPPASHAREQERQPEPPERASVSLRFARGSLNLGRSLFVDAPSSPAEALRAGEIVPSARWLDATGESAAVLDGPTDIRLEVDPGAQFFILEEAPLDLALVHGSIRVVVPPRGGTTPAPVRLATSAGTVEAAGSGDVLVSVDGRGSTRVCALAGRARWFRPGETTATGELPAGRMVRFRVGSDAATTAGPAGIDDARRLPPSSNAESAVPDVQRWLAGTIRSLDVALEESSEVTTAETELAEALEGASPGSGSASLRTRAVELAQRRLLVRGRLLANWERAVVAASREGAEQTLLGGRREKVRAWLVR